MKKSIIALMLLISVSVNAQKTTHGDCRTHIEASYEHGNYIVAITNYTSECQTYNIIFPDGYVRHQTLNIPAGKTRYYYYTSLFVHGPVIVIPINFTPATCPFRSVQVNL